MPTDEKKIDDPEAISRSAIHKVLDENKRAWLAQCFHFAATKQGYEYWKTIEALPPDTPLPAEAAAYLEEMRHSKIPEIDT